MSPKEARGDATPFLPERKSLKALREAAADCRGCHLYARATQTVFSDGPKGAAHHDGRRDAGRPRGPRRQASSSAPRAASSTRPSRRSASSARDVYLTNVVKHFKFEERGKRRIHQKPRKREVDACMPWLRAELDVVKPTALLLLGATAAKALLGESFRLTR